MNIWDILILCGVAAAVLLSLRQLRRNRSQGCGQDCASCMAACQRKKEA